ncbi:phage major capsid protein [Neobacillus sedimentimangrovi]|uniref:Phage major capsid protein n=1 Tax=Neobacillus sedimentimangrovi TaxID=2699460 RepID=A0ABS8QFZ1_9BACI|nr:phage major capsid protein [Neobacillus sedimentimangrovi]MCD4838164.1 phage major capsid protein [Neobacillus sedimentimangrovi]
MLKSVEMKEQLEALNNKAKALLNSEDAKLEDIQAINAEIETLQAKIAVQEKIEADEKAALENKKPAPVNQPKEDEVKAFINAVRSKFRNAMKEGSGADGGYTVPQDIQTKINELRESKDALQNLITVEPVKTLSGSRVFKARTQQTGFSEVAEGGTIAEKATPQFTQLSYSVKKYAGFFPVTNELLKDSDQAIEQTLIRWIGDESRVTRNKLILAELKKKAKTAIADVDDIKDTLNVTLDPAFRYTASIVTNQDGFNWLDKQKDADGNYLLQPSVTAPTGKQLFGVPVVMVSNKDLPSDTTDGTKAPFIIGDLKEAIVMFDRQTTEIMASDTAMDAFETDRTLFRAIEREEVKTRDAEAFVYGEVSIS